MSTARGELVLPVLLALLIAAAIVAIGVGSVHVPAGRVVEILISGGASQTATDTIAPDVRIVRQLRLPRVLLAMVVGAALSVAGAAFQGLLRNPLADPFILGTSSGAALAATIFIATGLSSLALGWLLQPLAAFVGSLLALLAVYLLARTGGRVPIEVLLLSGVIVNAFLFALVLLVLAVARLEAVEILLWLMGSLTLGARGELLALVAVVTAVGGTLVWVMARDLDVMSLGDDQAGLLGVATERLKRRVFVVVSLMVGAAVSVSGIIGFVGLIVPHLARMTVGAKHRVLIPASALLGALFLVVADGAARTLFAPNELPVGVVTALAGAPFFIVLLRRRKRAF